MDLGFVPAVNATLNAAAACCLVVGRRLARSGRLVAHRRLARFAWPVWMYVSVTGVLIYVLLYHLNPPA